MMSSSSTLVRTISVKMFSLCGNVLFICVSFSILNKMSSAESITSFFPDVKGNLSRVTWAHAVNNITYLNSTLYNNNIRMIEADVVLGTLTTNSTLPPLPIMGHPPANSSDLSLEDFLKTLIDFNNEVNSIASSTTEASNMNTTSNNNSTKGLIDDAGASNTNVLNATESASNISNTDAAVSNSSISSNTSDAAVSNSSISSSNSSSPVVQKTSRKGVKLDFKSIEVFNASIEILKKYSNVSFPLWLNADILPGPVNSTVTPVDATQFLSQAKLFTTATLSLGWTTATTNVTGSYTDDQIDSMIRTIRSHNITNEITFPVRSALAAESLPQMKKLLLGFAGSTLTLWSAENDQVNVSKLNNLIAEISVERIFVDVPDSLLKQLRLDNKPNSASLMLKTSWAFSLLTFVLVLFA